MSSATQATPTPGSPQSDYMQRVANYILLAVLLALLMGLLAKDVSSALTSATIFSHPFQLDESEGMIVAETMLLDKGVNIFDKPTQELFVAAPYPPLYYLLTWPVQHLAGAEPTFKAGRALALFSTLLVGVAIFGITRSLSRDALAGAIGAALWWSLSLVTFWGSLVKPDVLAVALGLSGLWWLVSRPPTQVWWALPFFLAAFFTKQTAIAAAVAGTGWLLVTRPRTGLTFGALYASGALLPILLFNWLTQGGYYYHLFTIHDLPWFSDRFTKLAAAFLDSYGIFLIPGMLGIATAAALWLSWRVRKHPQIIQAQGGLLLLLYLTMSFISTSGAGTLGGNHNHFLEWAAASCLGLGVGTAIVRRLRLWQTRITFALVALFLLFQIPSLFNTPPWLKVEFNQLAPDKTEGMINIFQYVTNNGGPAYSDNVGLMLATRKRLWSTDPFTQTHATLLHRWDERKLVEAISRKSFSQVILRIDVFAPLGQAGDVSPAILQAVQDNYKIDQRNVENIYVPK